MENDRVGKAETGTAAAGGLSILALLARLCGSADDVARVAIKSGDEAAEVLLRTGNAASDARHGDDAARTVAGSADDAAALRQTTRLRTYTGGPGSSLKITDLPMEDLLRLTRNTSRSTNVFLDIEDELHAATLAGDTADDSRFLNPSGALPRSRVVGALPDRPFDWSIEQRFNPLGRNLWPDEMKWTSLQDENIEWRPVIHVRDAKVRVREGPPRLLSFLPDTDSEYVRVFGRPMTESSRRALDKVLNEIGSAPRAKQVKMEFAEPRLLAWQLEQQIDDSRFVVIVGHSEDEGRILVFPSGQRVPVADIHRSCAELGSTCLVLTCYGDDFGLTGKVSAADALRMWNVAIDRHVASLEAITPAEFAHTMRVARSEQVTRDRVVLTTAIGSSGAIVWVAVSRHRNS